MKTLISVLLFASTMVAQQRPTPPPLPPVEASISAEDAAILKDLMNPRGLIETMRQLEELKEKFEQARKTLEAQQGEANAKLVLELEFKLPDKYDKKGMKYVPNNQDPSKGSWVSKTDPPKADNK